MSSLLEPSPGEEDLPETLVVELKRLSLLSDQELWQTARATVPANKRERIEALSTLAKQRDLAESEQQEVEELLYLYDQNMLLRAEAAVLLKERGYSVSLSDLR